MAQAFFYGLVVFLLVLGGLLLIFKFARKALKWTLIILAVLFIASAVFGVNLFSDMRDLQENFPKAQKLLLLKEDSRLYTGFESRLFSPDDALSYIDEEKLSILQGYYSVRDMSGVKDNHYKVIILDTSSFGTLDTVLLDGEETRTADVLRIIKAADTAALVVARTIKNENLPDTPETRRFVAKNFQSQGLYSDEDFRSYLFSQLFASAMEDDSLFLISGFKEGDILIYPETITFKLAKVVPSALIKSIFEKMVGD